MLWLCWYNRASQVALVVKNLPANAGGKRQGILACCSPWGRKESNSTATEQMDREGLGSVVKNLPAVQGTREMYVVSLGQNIPWRRAWQLPPLFLPGESHGQKSLAGTVQGVAKDLHLPHANSELQHVGSSSLTRDRTRAPCIGSVES